MQLTPMSKLTPGCDYSNAYNFLVFFLKPHKKIGFGALSILTQPSIELTDHMFKARLAGMRTLAVYDIPAGGKQLFNTERDLTFCDKVITRVVFPMVALVDIVITIPIFKLISG